ncbi:hypothetical protein L1D50_13230, partial [Pseudoalteromonas sp. Isolate6]|nr:hypothetical protein [Pseudoalteromonas sp. Isolate6]
FLYSLVSGILAMPIPQLFVSILIGLYLTAVPPKSHPIGKQENKVFTALILILFAIYSILAYTSYQCQSPFISGPNFWLNGQVSTEFCRES